MEPMQLQCELLYTWRDFEFVAAKVERWANEDRSRYMIRLCLYCDQAKELVVADFATGREENMRPVYYAYHTRAMIAVAALYGVCVNQVYVKKVCPPRED